MEPQLSQGQPMNRKLICFIDKEGVERRKAHRLRRGVYISKSPNYSWHIGFPKQIRGDQGTENSLAARIVREVMGDDAFNYGKSSSSQVWVTILEESKPTLFSHFDNDVRTIF